MNLIHAIDSWVLPVTSTTRQELAVVTEAEITLPRPTTHRIRLSRPLLHPLQSLPPNRPLLLPLPLVAAEVFISILPLLLGLLLHRLLLRLLPSLPLEMTMRTMTMVFRSPLYLRQLHLLRLVVVVVIMGEEEEEEVGCCHWICCLRI